MDNSDDREGALGGQARKRRRRTNKTASEPTFTAAHIDPLTLYSTSGAAGMAGVSDEGIAEWKKQGLAYIKKEDLGTRQDRIMGKWLIDFFEKLKTQH